MTRSAAALTKGARITGYISSDKDFQNGEGEEDSGRDRKGKHTAARPAGAYGLRMSSVLRECHSEPIRLRSGWYNLLTLGLNVRNQSK